MVFATSFVKAGVCGASALTMRSRQELRVKEKERRGARHGRVQALGERRVQSMRAAASRTRARAFFKPPLILAERPRTPPRSLPHPAQNLRCMFFYIFFLRPPPTHVAPGSLVTFTPKLANDLRTEDFPGEEELFYAWSPVAPDGGTEAFPAITAPQKLTVWRPGAFKECAVPLPPRARDGQAFRLVLATRAHARAHVANLAACDVGARPFPVLSVPVLVSARGAGRAEKQQQIERVYRLPVLSHLHQSGGRDAFLRIREQTSFDLDKVSVSRRCALGRHADCVGRAVESVG